MEWLPHPTLPGIATRFCPINLAGHPAVDTLIARLEPGGVIPLHSHLETCEIAYVLSASGVLVEGEDDAKSIIASLKKGGSFEEIAKKSSKDPGSGANGGDLDWAAAGSYVKEFSDAMVALEKGKTTEAPVKSQFGFHVIRLDDVREAQLPKFDDVKPQILEQLQQQKLAKFQQDLRAKAKVE